MINKTNFAAVKEPQKISSYWKKEWRVAAIIVLTGTVFNAAMSIGPVMQGRIIDMLTEGVELNKILLAVAIFLLIIAAIQGTRYLKRYYVRVFANRTGATMRKTVYANLMHRAIASLKAQKIGDLMTKAISDVDACVEGMRKLSTEVFDTGVLMTSYFITMLCYDVRITVCAAIFIPVAMLLAEKLKKTIFAYTKSYRAQLSDTAQLTYETIENAMLYRVYSADDANLAYYNKQLALLERKAVKANILENSMQPIYNIISMSGVAAIVILGGQNVIGKIWSIGEFSAYLTIFTALAIKASKAARLFNSVQKAQVSWRRIVPYLAQYDKEPRNAAKRAQHNALRVDGMSFAYEGTDKNIVEDISFAAETGELIGITGPVASGKSTIGLALQGLYPYKGSIMLNECELRECTAAYISDNIAYMGHDSQLLSDSIYNNITLGDNGEIDEVLQDVCFDIDLASMPQGVATQVGASGLALSGGQCARLALARALYHKAPVLVLDDPFAAVDINTERQIVFNLKQHYTQCIIILISHRVASFAVADTVVLVENGKAQCATHQELLQTATTYRNIVAMQREVRDDAECGD